MPVDDFDVEEFRESFPEFSDETKYPDSMIAFWAGYGDTLLNVQRWGNRRQYGMFLFVAHNISLAAMNAAGGASGAVPGFGIGVVSSESAGPISHSMDTQLAAIQDGANWNLTSYGVQYLQLARIVGTGGIHV